ncbi:EF-hand domain-containing protein [Luteibacter sp.]|uniref:EF-hand domain-containing protein n=1 Tax=Luteibacter sp. TaxID=1886636 RepID=UPI003F7FFB59
MKMQVCAVTFGASLLLAGAAFAQTAPANQTPPPPPPGQTMPADPSQVLPPPPPGEATPPPPPADNPASPGMPPPAAAAPPPPPPPPPAPPGPPPPPPPGGDTGTAGMTSGTTMPTPQGQVQVNSGPAQAKPAGPAPDFATLSGGKGSITPEQASAYPLLANDFQYADSNRDGRISKAEYQKWVAHSGAGQ